MNKLIAHALIKIDGKYLVIKRTKIKRGKPNTYPEYWDIPGGMVEEGELPKDAAIRETKEEVNLDIKIGNIIHEDSNLDNGNVYTRLVYEGILLSNKNDILLQKDEHDEYKLITNLSDLDGEEVVDYLHNIIEK